MPFPNPTRDAASFTLDLPRTGEVAFAVLDVQGRIEEGFLTPRTPFGMTDWEFFVASAQEQFFRQG
jgi:hypothetical protein